MAVDESRRDETAAEIDDIGTGELAPADIVAAQPRHDAVADRHGGGVGMGRAVHPAVDQQRRGIAVTCQNYVWPRVWQSRLADDDAVPGGLTAD